MIEGSEHRYTLEEFWRLVETFPEHKYEYIDGYVRMMTGGSPAHSQIGANVNRVLGNALYDKECNVYNSDLMIQLSEDRCYYPDAVVSCDPRDWAQKKVVQSPSVVVEVLSPGTERIDKNEKLAAYQKYPTIQDILLVDSRRCYVEHYHRVDYPKWEISYYESGDNVVELECIEVSFSVRELYHKVYLELED
ncbi:MAG TPA: Uma2 family endonuclease [Dictyobacter sp.]|jgi:Uma2 family endonuclease|nr:Uma2 family endonuclease [Dictyobacter sp.]